MFRTAVHLAWLLALSAAWHPSMAGARPGEADSAASGAVGPDSASAASADTARTARPRIGLALSGGGARGLAQVGILEVFEEEGIPIDAIAGSSMGAVVGGLYAAGNDADGLADIARDRDLFRSPNAWENLSAFQKWVTPPRAFGLYFRGWEYRLPRSLVSDVNVNRMLVEHATPANLFAKSDFDSLPIPFRTQALDLKSGEMVILRRGDLARAIRSSMAVAVAFPPIPSRNPERLFVDPGPVNNLPVELAREMGVDRVIAVNCAATWDEREVGTDASLVARDLLRVLSQRVDSTTIKGWDAWIQPDVAQASFMDWDQVETFIQAGSDGGAGLPAEDPGVFPARNAPGGPTRPGIADLQRRLGALRVGLGTVGGAAELLHVGAEAGVSPGAGGPVLPRPARPGNAEALRDRALRSGLAHRHAGRQQSRRHQPRSRGARAWLCLDRVLYYNSRRGRTLIVEVLRDNLLRIGETFHASLFVGNFRDGAEAGIRSSHLRGVPLGLDLLLRSERLRYEQERDDSFRQQNRAIQLGTSLAVGADRLLLAGVRYEHDEGEGSRDVADWSDHSTIVSLTWLEDDTDERELPARGRRLGLHYEAHLEDLPGRPPQRVIASAAGSVPRGPVSFTLGGRAAATSRAGLPFQHRNRLDLTRATWGRFEPGLYAPVTAEAGATAAVRPAENLSIWARGVVGLRGPTLRDLRRKSADPGMEIGLLQRTPLGPILLGSAFERGRGAFLFVQVGHDPVRLP